MASWSPTLEGFRTMFRRPSFSLAEIAWRWCFGGTALFLSAVSLLEYLDTLPVSNSDRILLRTAHPVWMLRAVSHILRGSALRFGLAAIILALGLALAWILLASVGRAVILNPLLEEIQRRARQKRAIGDFLERSSAIENQSVRAGVPSLAGLNFLRIAVTLSAFFSVWGAFIAANAMGSEKHPHPGLSFLAWLLLVLVIGCAWTYLNWFLSLASVFVVRNGQHTFAALSSVVGLCRERLGAVAAVGTWFGLAHLTLFVIATSVVGFPLSIASIVPAGFVLLGILFVTFAYFAVADSLYIGRLAGYIAILEAPPVPAPTPPVALGPYLPQLPSSASATPASSMPPTMVDQDELILSDQTVQTNQQSEAIAQRTMVDQDELILSDPARCASTTSQPPRSHPVNAPVFPERARIDQDEPILGDRTSLGSFESKPDGSAKPREPKPGD